MNDEKGINKSALGIRYLIKYLENHREENFFVVKNCLKEVRLWLLITFYGNNMDYLEQDIPEEYLKDIFLMKPFILENKEQIDYGKGYHTNSKSCFKDQFREIRNALIHGDFIFQDNIIHVNMSSGQANFDVLWLEKLTFTVLSHDKYLLKKGMYDIHDISLVPLEHQNISFKSLIQNGFIYVYRVTSNTSNKKTIYDALNYRGITPDDCTFDFICEVVKNRIKSLTKISLNLTPDHIIKEIQNSFHIIEKEFRDHVKIELLPIKANEELLDNSDFNKLDYMAKIQYIMNALKIENPMKYNSLVCKFLLDLLEKLEKEENYQKEAFFLRDAFPFLAKVYANLCFNGIFNLPNICEEYLAPYGVKASFVHAKNIYKDYLKVLNRTLKELKTYHGEAFIISDTINEINIISKYLEEVLNQDAYKRFSRNMRNSIVHSQVEFYKDYIRFFTTGKNLHLPRYNKKKQIFERFDYINTKPIWEMIIKNNEFIALLDDLFIKSNVEIKVNISKYMKRSTYGR